MFRINKKIEIVKNASTSFLRKTWPILSAIILVLATIFSYRLFFWNKIYPNIYINDIYLGGKTVSNARDLLNSKIVVPQNLILEGNGQTFEIPLKEISFYYKLDESVSNAFKKGRSKNFVDNFRFLSKSLFNKTSVPLLYNLNQEKFDSFLSVIAGQVAIEPVFPSIELAGESVLVQKGFPGEEIDMISLKANLDNNFSRANYNTIKISVVNTNPSLNDDEINTLKKRAEPFIGKNLVLEFEDQKIILTDKELVNFLEPKGGLKINKITETVESISKKIERSPENAVFVFEEGRVKEFTAAKTGVSIKKKELSLQIESALNNFKDNQTLAIPVDQTQPEITIEDVNNLGIKEMIGKGTSKFAHSIPSRIHNISLASSKINGILVAPGETFSFNEKLGDVSSYTGYKQAYIIQGGKTVLGDGGGVCQVSTTLFRAVLNAGLPIIERRAHAYRVAYYEQDSPPGIDATVYSPTTDFKFKNDTPGHILIQTKVDEKKYSLAYEIYGTSDGRVSEITKPVVTNVSAPPEDLYTDDPTIPMGVIKQIDFKAWGAKVTFNYTVQRNGEIIYEKTFVSNYRPWQAKFLRGTGAVN